MRPITPDDIELLLLRKERDLYRATLLNLANSGQATVDKMLASEALDAGDDIWMYPKEALSVFGEKK